MFALSPISGRLTERYGSPVVIAAGLAVLAISSVLAAVSPPDGGALLFVALFLLGYGWNMGFVAGSALLTHGLAIPERTRLQGFTDAFIWSSAAAASLSSGLVVDGRGTRPWGSSAPASSPSRRSCFSGRGPAGPFPPPPASRALAAQAYPERD